MIVCMFTFWDIMYFFVRNNLKITTPNDCVLCIEGAEYLVFVRGYTQSLYMESLQYPGNLDNMDDGA